MEILEILRETHNSIHSIVYIIWTNLSDRSALLQLANHGGLSCYCFLGAKILLLSKNEYLNLMIYSIKSAQLLHQMLVNNIEISCDNLRVFQNIWCFNNVLLSAKDHYTGSKEESDG